MTDKELDLCISELAYGNRNKLKELYNEMKRPIFLFVLSLVKNYQTAEDITQDVFVKIIMSAAQYQQGTKPKAWIFSIARSLSLDTIKKVQHISFDTVELFNFSEDVKDVAKQTEKVMLALEALSQLSEQEKEIVSLYLYGDLKQTEIAKVLNLPYLQVRSKYAYAIKKLKKYFERKGVQYYE